MTRHEICCWCHKRQPLGKLSPLVSAHEETRQYKCRNEAACLVRVIRKKRLGKVIRDE